MAKKETRPRRDRSAEAHPPHPRRVPTQDRGKARVEAILDAAERLFADVGYDAATTEAIAARAGASIGSLYQFFPNKRALFEGVTARYLERVKTLFDAAVSVEPPPGTPWESILDGAIDAFWALTSGDPGFSAVWLQGRVTKELIAAGLEVNRAFAERSEQIMRRFAPSLPKATRALVAIVLVEAATGMLFAAARANDASSPKLIDETKRMLRAYLRDVLTRFPAADAADGGDGAELRSGAPPPRARGRSR